MSAWGIYLKFKRVCFHYSEQRAVVTHETDRTRKTNVIHVGSPGFRQFGKSASEEPFRSIWGGEEEFDATTPLGQVPPTRHRAQLAHHERVLLFYRIQFVSVIQPDLRVSS